MTILRFLALTTSRGFSALNKHGGRLARHGSRSLSSDSLYKSDNIGTVRDEFSRQAAVFEDQWDARMKRGNDEILDWAMAAIGPVKADTVGMDVAAGTAILARRLAGHCRQVVAMDATEAMLSQGRKKAAEEGGGIVGF